jgi:hypothetical protein
LLLEGGGDGRGIGEGGAVECEAGERIGGLGGDGRRGTLYKSVKWRTPDRHNAAQNSPHRLAIRASIGWPAIQEKKNVS